MRYSTSQLTTGLFPQATVWLKGSTTADQTINLSERANLGGTYTGNVTINTEGDYEIVTRAYTDSGRTVLSESAPTVTEQVQVQTTDVNIGARPSTTVAGFFDEDIEEIVKRVIAALDKRNIWQMRLQSGRTAEQELIAKSEFDVQKDTVELGKTIPLDATPLKEYFALQIDVLENLLAQHSMKPEMDALVKQLKKKKDEAPEMWEKVVRLLEQLQSKEGLTVQEKQQLQQTVAIGQEILSQLPKDQTDKVLQGFQKTGVLMEKKLGALASGSDMVEMKYQLQQFIKLLEDNKEKLLQLDDRQYQRWTQMAEFLVKAFTILAGEVRSSSGLYQLIGQLKKNLAANETMV